MVNVYTGKREFKAMGCEMAAWLFADEQFAAEPLETVETLFLQEEQRLTRFDPQSELMQLNSRPNEWVAVSDELWDLVRVGMVLSEKTNGCFDCTLLNELEHSGYTNSFEPAGVTGVTHVTSNLPPDAYQIHLKKEVPEFDTVRQMIRLPAGVRLDLGGIAKGYTAQASRDFLHPIGPCLIDAGGDLTAGDGPGKWPGWPVGISVPWSEDNDEETEIGRLWLAHGTLATSGVDYRRWRQGGTMAHHIIDPRTGRPAETNLLTVSVIDKDACTAEAWATATLVAGLEEGLAMLEENRIAAVLIDENGEAYVTQEMHPHFQPA
ncbi:MAG: FAD:protein FMN transferase [Anaerolineae bacterium]